eukprot:gene9841-biopygen8247
MTLTPDELVRSNRFESLGLLAGGIAHDFNNLLTTILGAVSLAKDNRDASALGDAEQACITAKGLTKQLLAFAKGGVGTQSVCAPKEILDDSLKIAAAASTAEITKDYQENVEPVQVDRAQILQVFQNLIVNALQAMPPPPHRPRLQIRASNVTLADDQVPALPAGDYVEFEVRDNGSGIKPEHVEKIFDPFFTTKKHGTDQQGWQHRWALQHDGNGPDAGPDRHAENAALLDGEPVDGRPGKQSRQDRRTFERDRHDHARHGDLHRVPEPDLDAVAVEARTS